VRYLTLMQLVTIKLTAWRLKDRVHLQDMIGVGLIDGSWPSRLPDSRCTSIHAREVSS
jgi:hypothetical protein